jgi:uncharacterized protein
MRRSIGLLLALLLLVSAVWAEVAVPPLGARVTDQTQTLDASAKQRIETKLAALEQAKGAQIAVLLVAATAPESIEQYALRVAEAWKLGRKGVDDGALLLIAKDERALRIEVGYGLEGAIPDAMAKRIIAEIIVPRFKTGDFAGGVDAGVDALIKLVQGEPLPAPEKSSGDAMKGLGDTLPTAMMFIFILGGVLRMIFGRLVGAGVAATVSFLGAWLLLGSLLLAVIVAVVAFVFVLASGASVGGRRGGFGGGGFGGGGGGFGGGGGGFGGGGASGRW